MCTVFNNLTDTDRIDNRFMKLMNLVYAPSKISKLKYT